MMPSDITLLGRRDAVSPRGGGRGEALNRHTLGGWGQNEARGGRWRGRGRSRGGENEGGRQGVG